MTPSATVVVLTWNGERYLESLLTAVEGQDYPGETEILVIDSGSTDRTLEIVRAHPRVRLHEIPNAEFGHGRTRDLAARLASGEFVAYLTHDAVPASPHWLAALLAPMLDDDRIAAVLGKQLPRPGCHPMLKYEIRSVFAGLGPDSGVTVFRDDGSLRDRDALERAGFYSDVNSAARRDVLTGPVPYRDVAYAEDQLFGRDLIASGRRKAYAPAAAVIHSNDLTIREAHRRAIDEAVGLRRIGSRVPVMTRRAALAAWLRGSVLDAARIARDPDFGLGARLKWWLVNPWYQAAKWSGHRRGTIAAVEIDPAALPLPGDSR